MEDKLTASLTPQQWDFVGKLLADTINLLAPQVRQATAIMQSLQGQLNGQPKPVATNGAANHVPEVEVDVSPRSPIP